MNVLFVSEADWILGNRIPEHHMIERLSVNHRVTVTDFDNVPGSSVHILPRTYNNSATLYKKARIRLVRAPTLNVSLSKRTNTWMGKGSLIGRFVHTLLQPWIILAELLFNRPDVIVLNAQSTGLQCIVLARLFRIPILFHVVDNKASYFSNKKIQSLLLWIEKNISLHVDMITTNGPGLRDRAIEWGVDPRKTRFISHCVDLDRYYLGKKYRETMRKELNIGKEQIMVFFMGRLYPFCNMDTVVEQLLKHPDGKKCVVVLAGGGEQFDSIKKLKEKYVWGKNIRLLGQTPYKKIPALLAASDICLLPFSENGVTRYIVPAKVFEYSAMGKPTIALRLPTLFKRIPEGNGVVYEDTVDALVAQIIALSKNAKKRKQLEQKAELFGNSLDCKTIALEFEETLLALIRKKK
jgi:glycosyltransferase involved in cell wall biosynthesis